MTFILVPINVILVYLLGAFVQWELNAGLWPMDARLMMAFFMAFTFIFSVLGAAQIEATK